MIFNMVGGGGTAKGSPVVAVASTDNLPSNADIGTLVIISSIAANDVYVNPTEPSAPETGDVWIVPVDDATFSYTIGNAEIPFSTLYQYDGSAWVEMDVRQYTEDGWTASGFFLLNGGEVYSDITGGYRICGWYSGKVETLATGYHLTGTHKSQIQTKNKIDLTGYRTLHCAGELITNKVTLLIQSSASSSGTGFSEENGISWGTTVASVASETLGEFELVLDITDYNTTPRYVAVSGFGECMVTKIWLEE